MTRKLEIMSNVAIIVLCATVSGVLIKRWFLPPPTVQPVPAVSKGESLDLPAALAAGEAERVVIVALAPGCGFCKESMPFYRTLGKRRQGNAANLRIVTVVRDAVQVEQERALLRTAGVEVDEVVVADFKALGVPGTPMVIVADRRGAVLGAWLGKLAADEEQEVLATLGLKETLAQASPSDGMTAVVAGR